MTTTTIITPKIAFDAEDRPPASYFGEEPPPDDILEEFPLQKKQSSSPVSKVSKDSKLDKSEWWKAPEFVPRSAQVKIIAQQPGAAVTVNPVYPSQNTSPEHHLQEQPYCPVPPIQSQPGSTVTPPPPVPGGTPGPANALSQGFIPQGQTILNPSVGVLPPAGRGPHKFAPVSLEGGQPSFLPHHHHGLFPSLMPQHMVPLPSIHRLPGGLPLPLRPGFRFPLKPPLHPLATSAAQNGRQQRSQQLLMGKPFFNIAAAAAAAQGIYGGYTANIQSVDSPLGGAPIPTIVLKKKRKKRHRKNKSKTTPIGQEQQDLENKSSSVNPEDPSMTVTAKTDDEDKDSGIYHGELRRSVPDLTKISMNQSISGPEGGNAGKENEYPNDLDLLQTVLDSSLPLHGSCPDLSEAQKELLDEFWNLEELGFEDEDDTASNFSREVSPRNPLSQQTSSYESPKKKSASPAKAAAHHPSPKVPTGYRNPMQDLIGTTRNSSNPPTEDYDISSIPVFNALQEAVSEGHINSPAVKELDKQIMAEMKLPMTRSYGPQDDQDEDDEDDEIFDRLIGDHEKRQMINFASGNKSLMEEMEEKELLFPDRPPLQLAAVHGRNGVKSFAFDSENPENNKLTKTRIDALFPPSTFIENDEESGDPMHITVNAFEDPDELVIDEASIESGSRLEKLQGAFKKWSSVPNMTAKHGANQDGSLPLQPPSAKVCCALM